MNMDPRMAHSPWGAREAVVPTRRSAVRSNAPTTLIEQLLLATSVALLPLQDALGNVAGVSPIFILFAAMGTYALVFRSSQLLECALHRVSVSAYLLIIVLGLMELQHPNPSFRDIIRFGFMIAGGVFMASLCRDAPALRSLLWGVVGAGTLLSIYMFTISYAHLSTSTASTFRDASYLRMRAFEQSELQANLNKLAFMSGQAAVVAAAWSLLERKAWVRAGLLITALTCLVAAFLPLSRSGMMIALIACGTLLLKSGRIGQMRSLLFVGMAIGAMWLWVPNAAFARLTFGSHQVNEDSRERIYINAFETSEEYLPFGIGFGNYWSSWALKNGFSAHVDGELIPIGAHNVPLQFLICAGIPAVIVLLLLVWVLIKSMPRGELDRDALATYGLAVAASLLLLVTHQFYDKSFSQIIGVFIGGSLWIWPQRERTRSNAR